METRTEVHGCSTEIIEGCSQETRFFLPIRVLYTVNASPQFLLARQRRKVRVLPITWHKESMEVASTSGLSDSTIGPQRFAKVSLKICLGAVCTCSPELLADRSRDYSVYVLDPLESTSTTGNHMNSRLNSPPADTQLSDATSSCTLREGVSTGMGLMSWCLSNDCVAVLEADDDDGCVVGKVVKDRGEDALEVVMFLRETTPQSQQQHAHTLSALGVYSPSTTSLLDHHSHGHAQISSSVPSSPKCHVPSTQLEISQGPIRSTGPSSECVLDFGGPSIPEPASSSASGHTRRVGRPPGTATNPEKRARRLAIQSHKEMLERMENIARMQRGEQYDKSLIRASDQDRASVTDEELARQRKILEELESRPLIVDKSRLLTTKPLPKRARSSTSVSLSKNTASKPTPRFSSSNTATASGSGVKSVDSMGGQSASNTSTNNFAKYDHEAQDLLSLLTSVLGKVDGCSTSQPKNPGSQKGTDKGVEDTLAGVLKELLPFIPNFAVQASGVSFQGVTSSPISTVPTSVVPRATQANQWNASQRTLPSNAPLFKTADETFHHSQLGPNSSSGPSWPINVAWSIGDYPRVHEDAHPVPGGGWARGKNLVPRTATSMDPMPSPSQRVAFAASITENRGFSSAAEAQPDKENTPPKQTSRGMKRALSTTVETKEMRGVQLTANEKKRKQNPEQELGSQDTGSANRAAVGLKARNKTNTFGGSGLVVAASSPSRSAATARAAQNLPVMAMSEPDYIVPPPPIVATSTFPDLIIEPPRTPLRPETSLDDNAGDSLFTPCALDHELTSRFRGGIHHPDNGPPSSPSIGRRKSRGSHVANHSNVATLPGRSSECSGTKSDSQEVRTGWDLPPSSPPPPTSPISPHADIGSEQDDNMVFELTAQPPIGSAEVEKCGTDGNFVVQGPTTKCDGVSTAVVDEPSSLASHTPDCSSDFDSLVDPDFDFSWLSQCQEGNEGNELDVEELWSSLGPVISQAQSDSVTTSNQTSSPVEADFSCFDLGSDLSHVETEAKSGVDAVKLADDLKALFGGCVV